MITLLQNGAWLLNGQEIVEDTADSTAILNSKLGYVPEKKDAATQTCSKSSATSISCLAKE